MDLSNIRVTTKVAVNALLGDTPALQDYGTAIMHNLGTKEVKAVVCINPLINLHSFFLFFFALAYSRMLGSPSAMPTIHPSCHANPQRIFPLFNYLIHLQTMPM